MRVLRTSVYTQMHMMPMTTIVRDSDLTGGIDAMVKAELDLGHKTGLFVVHDIFDIEPPPQRVGSTDEPVTIEHAAVVMLRRFKETETAEMHMSTTYHWGVQSLRQLSANGVLSTSLPCPLTSEQIWAVMQQLSKHIAYKGQLIVIHDKDANTVKMKDGNLFK